MQTLLQDLRFGLRMLAKNPGFTAVAVLTLALGIGANTAIFSVVNAVLLRPLPYQDSARLVSLWTEYRFWGFSGPGALTDPDYIQWEKQNQVFDRIAAYRGQTSNLTGDGDPERLQGAIVTASLFPLLGIAPQLGRAFSSAEEKAGQENVVLLSSKLWARRYHSDPAILGKTLTLDGKSFTLIGVMPASFQFPNQAEFWVPLVFTADRSNAMDQVVAHLRPGVTLERAQSDIRLIAHRLNPAEGENAVWLSLVYLQDQMASNIRPALLILLAAVGVVLLIACVNITNLLLARAAAREREIVIRKALGGSQLRILRQMLTESVLLASFGGAFGLLLSVWVQGALVSLLPANLGEPGFNSQIIAVNMDAWVLGFTASISIASGILFGLAPSLQVSRLDAYGHMKESSATLTPGLRLTGLRGLLTVGQIALTMALLVSAGLLIRSLISLMRVNPGFQPNNVLTMNLELPATKYQTPEQMRIFHDAVLERVEALPGVSAAATVGYGLPFGGGGLGGDFTIEGQPAPPQGVSASKLVISPGYFQAMRIPLLEGRYFSRADSDESPHVAIVSQSFAEQFWPQGKALGHRFDPGFTGDSRSWCSVVGIVGDVKQRGLASEAPMTIYLPYSQAPRPFLMSWMALVMRTPSSPLEMANAVRREVQSVDPDMPIFGVASMEQLISGSLAAPRFRSLLFACFAALALALAAVGIYGVLSYSVAQRTHEIGIRMALGASREDVLKSVVGQGIKLTLFGVALGIFGALVLTRYLSSFLYGVKPADPLTFIAVAMILTCVALLACYIPARRATKVDPMVALRYE